MTNGEVLQMRYGALFLLHHMVLLQCPTRSYQALLVHIGRSCVRGDCTTQNHEASVMRAQSENHLIVFIKSEIGSDAQKRAVQLSATPHSSL